MCQTFLICCGQEIRGGRREGVQKGLEKERGRRGERERERGWGEREEGG